MKKALSVFLAVLMMMSCAALSLQAFAADEIGVKTIDIDFTCDPKEGQKVGSDYTISLTGTDLEGNSEIPFGTDQISAETQTELCQGGTTNWTRYVYNYVVITKDDGEIVYPGIQQVDFAPRRTKVTEDSDPNASRGTGAVYELGSKYNYYLVARIASPYTFSGGTFSVRLNGKSAPDSYTKYYDNDTLVQFLGSRTIGHNVNTINITFSCNPENGAPVGSDYEIDIDMEADLVEGKELVIVPRLPFVNEPDCWDYHNIYSKDSLVAIYESDTLLYPGYVTGPIMYAPAKTHAEAHGSDPTGEIGTPPPYDENDDYFDHVSTPAFYQTGKTYRYYATFAFGPWPWYQIADDTEVFVNGIKVTDYEISTRSNNTLQIPVATVTCGHTHTMTFHEAVAATAYKEGNVAYYHCETCGKNYADEAGIQEIDNVVIAKLPRPNALTDLIARVKSFFELIKEFFLKLFKRSN